MRRIKSLSELDLSSSGRSRPLGVCIVSSEILGPIKNGGIGTATTGLVNNLTTNGHKVTILYTQVWSGVPLCQEKTWEHWVQYMGVRNIELAYIPHEGNYSDWRQKSWLVKDFIGERTFDLVYFNEHHGSGYYSLAAKRAGISPFAHQMHCVITHGSIEWVLNTNDQLVNKANDLEMIGLERRSVESADVVIGPSRYLLHEYERYGWALPKHTYCQPYVLPRPALEIDESQRSPVEELVFFGRLEVRKGLWLFCEAIDRIKDRLKGRTVTFMGRMTNFSGASSGALIVNRAANWPFQVRLLTRAGSEEALEYLRGPGRLAVMPSLADNSPCVVYECLGNQIPFVTSAGSGANELVHRDCWDNAMVEPTVDALVEKLAEILDNGAKPSQPQFGFTENWETWSAWHRWLSENRDQLASPALAYSLDTSKQKTLFIIVDIADISLSLLLENASKHFERFGADAEFLIITARREPMMGLLESILRTHASHYGSAVRVMGPEDLDDLRKAILEVDVAFIAGVQDEVLVTFFAQALTMLGQKFAAAVSCVVAEKDRGADQSHIEEIPCGNVPAMAALGRPIGSSVCAISVPSVREELEDLLIYHHDYGELVSARSLCNTVLGRVNNAGKTVHLIPNVGAIRTNGKGTTRNQHLWYREARQSAMDLGLPVFIGPRAAAWFAISRYGSYGQSGAIDIPGQAMLPDSHPLHSAGRTGDAVADVAELAAALGRLDEALQVTMAQSALDEARVHELTEITKNAIRNRQPVNLLERLVDGPIWHQGDSDIHTSASTDFPNKVELRAHLRSLRRREDPGLGVPEEWSAAIGKARSELIEAVATSDNDAIEPGDLEKYERIYLQNCHEEHDFQISSDSFILSPNPAGSTPTRLVFLDVPLAGHMAVSTEISLLHRHVEPVVLRVIALDQRTGDEIGRDERCLQAEESDNLRVPLHGLHLMACIIVETESHNARPGSVWGRFSRLEVR